MRPRSEASKTWIESQTPLLLPPDGEAVRGETCQFSFWGQSYVQGETRGLGGRKGADERETPSLIADSSSLHQANQPSSTVRADEDSHFFNSTTPAKPSSRFHR